VLGTYNRNLPKYEGAVRTRGRGDTYTNLHLEDSRLCSRDIAGDLSSNYQLVPLVMRKPVTSVRDHFFVHCSCECDIEPPGSISYGVCNDEVL